VTVVEYFAAAFGIAGTLLLALNGKRAGWGFVAFLASNAGWIWFALEHGHRGLLMQQIAFTATSLLGIWRWFDGHQLMCAHVFNSRAIRRVSPDRVESTCTKCGKVCNAPYGIVLPGRLE
jgi:nicotinamide riboside transporter PnuC